MRYAEAYLLKAEAMLRGGDVAGAGGGEDRITLSAGGTDREADLGTNTFSDPPSFGATRSRCGGNFAMLVDTSGSIDKPNGADQPSVPNMASVRAGILAFIDSFAGSPIKLEIVRFSSTASTLGAVAGPTTGDGWSRYYDMLVDADVAHLKAQVATLTSTGGTNWEDGMFRVFKNRDGTVQSTLPDTLIFFTDGIPTRSRLDSTSSTPLAPAVVDPDDIGLPVANGGSYNQVSWNRTWRIARDYYADVDRFIGVYIGNDTTGTSNWLTQGAGYHLENFIRGFHQTWDRGHHLENFQRGYRNTWDRGYRLSNPQRGYHLEYQRATTGIRYERYSSGWKSSNVGWTGSTYNYASSNLTNLESDNWRTRITGTPGGWVTMTSVGAKTPLILYNQSNLTGNTDESDGYRIAKVYSAPYDAYESVSDATFIAGNSGLPGTIAPGWTASVLYTAPFSYWGATTQSAYNGGNTTGDASDGWRLNTLYSAPYSAWESVTEAAYVANNSTADNSDGWTASTVYTAPFSSWVSVSQADFNSGNSTPDALDGWRVSEVYSAPYTGWVPTTEALFTANNTATGNGDGWDATKVYTQPYTFRESVSSVPKLNSEIIGRIVSEGANVPAVLAGGEYTNAEVADLYVETDWSKFAVALNSVALAECGGTITVQTRVGTAAAADPFTYLYSVNSKTATTSAVYRSGTFEIDLAGGAAATGDISPLNLSGIDKYEPVGWSCKSAGVNHPFTTTPIPNSPWSKITLTVSPNQAVSCIQTVKLK